jgi:hypothetical protein
MDTCLHCELIAHVKRFANAHRGGKIPPLDVIVAVDKVLCDLMAIYFALDPITDTQERTEFVDEIINQTRLRTERQFQRALVYSENIGRH